MSNNTYSKSKSFDSALIFAFVLSALLHGLLLWKSDSIQIEKRPNVDKILKVFKVKVTDIDLSSLNRSPGIVSLNQRKEQVEKDISKTDLLPPAWQPDRKQPFTERPGPEGPESNREVAEELARTLAREPENPQIVAAPASDWLGISGSAHEITGKHGLVESPGGRTLGSGDGGMGLGDLTKVGMAGPPGGVLFNPAGKVDFEGDRNRPDTALRPTGEKPEVPSELNDLTPGLGEISTLKFADDVEYVKNLDDYINIEIDTWKEPGERGYFELRIIPNEKSKELPEMPQEIIFCLDASASMGKRTFASLQEGLKMCVMSLEPHDRFNIIGFKRDVTSLAPSLVVADAVNKAKALIFIDDLEPSGKTDIYSSLLPLAKMGANTQGVFTVMLLSDGRPNVGVISSRNIINVVSGESGENTSIFTFGAAGSENRYLLDLLAYRNKGKLYMSSDIRNIPDELRAAYMELSSPLLAGLRFDCSGVPKEDIYPKRLMDLYRGQPLVFYGRYDNEKSLAVRIRGYAGGIPQEFIFEVDIPQTSTETKEIAQNWGYQRAYHLIAEMCRTGETSEKRGVVISLVGKYNLAIPYEF